MAVIRYRLPQRRIAYDPGAIVNELTGAKAAVLALTQIPDQRAWAEALRATEITETDFYRVVNRLPTAKTRLVTSK